MDTAELVNVLHAHRGDYHPVVPFDAGRDRLYPLDFTAGNAGLSAETISDTELFASYINAVLQRENARYGIGGYGEHRTLYARSKHFGGVGGEADAMGAPDISAAGLPGFVSGNPESEARDANIAEEEPRRLHLGIDIWGSAGTKIMSPLDGIVHSFAFNNNDSDYGATMIVTHNLDGVSFYILYGHLSLSSLKNLHEGKRVRRGEVIAETGMRFENGNWPPHLHFQLIGDIGDWKGDYPGVCKYSERESWLANCPDPDLVLLMMDFADL